VQQPLEDWMNRKWRPAMGWLYFVVCITDFIVFPVLWALFYSNTGNSIEAWEPLTLKGGGLFHVAMGAVLGIAAWSRGQEKMLGVNYGSRQPTYGDYGSHSYPTQENYRNTTSARLMRNNPRIINRQGRPGPLIEEPEL
jgi:hypothetical protein